MHELAKTFCAAMTRFFEEIPNSVRAATRPVLEIMDEAADAQRVEYGEGSLGAVTIATPKGSSMEVYFGHNNDGEVALRIDLRANSLKELSAVIDIASAGMVGLDGVSMVEHWSER